MHLRIEPDTAAMLIHEVVAVGLFAAWCIIIVALCVGMS